MAATTDRQLDITDLDHVDDDLDDAIAKAPMSLENPEERKITLPSGGDDVMDEIIEESAEEEEEEEESEPEPEPPKKIKKKEPAPPVEPMKKLDINEEFAKALRKTLPKPPPPPKEIEIPEEEEEEEDDESSVASSKDEEEEPKKKEKEDEEDEAESDAGKEQEDDLKSTASSEVEGDEKETKPKPKMTKEEEYMEKMKTIEDIKRYIGMGIIPPQEPVFSMPLSLLVKIRDYMAESADEVMGIGMIATVWVQTIGVLEKLNGSFDPFAKIFGRGLRTAGLKAKMEKKIDLYEGVFRHIYRKIPKDSEISPWIQFVLITAKLIGETHIENIEREMKEEAERARKDPELYQKVQTMHEMYRQQKEETEREKSRIKPMTEDDIFSEEEEEKVDLKAPQTESKEDPIPEQKKEEVVEADDEEEEDDDDVVIEVKEKGKK